MKSSRWLRRFIWVLVSILLLTALGFVAEKIDRGIVMRPVRKLAGKAKIVIQPPKLTPEEMEIGEGGTTVRVFCFSLRGRTEVLDYFSF